VVLFYREKMSQPNKKEYVQKMFAGISQRYDLLNHLLSLDWINTGAGSQCQTAPGYILDVCSGTGDVAIEVSKNNSVIASDFCYEMLQLCMLKIKTGIEGISAASRTMLRTFLSGTGF